MQIDLVTVKIATTYSHADWKHPMIDTVTCILHFGFSDVNWIFTVSAVVPNGIVTTSLGPLF